MVVDSLAWWAASTGLGLQALVAAGLILEVKPLARLDRGRLLLACLAPALGLALYGAMRRDVVLVVGQILFLAALRGRPVGRGEGA